MALSQTDVDRLEKALAGGVLTVEIEGKRITYQTIDALLKALDYAKSVVAAATADGVVTQSFVQFTRD